MKTSLKDYRVTVITEILVSAGNQKEGIKIARNLIKDKTKKVQIISATEEKYVKR